MKLYAKTVIALCVAGLSGIVVIALVMWGYDYLDISRSAVALGSWIILCPIALICTWLANGRLWSILATILGCVFLGASGMILMAYLGNANNCVLYAAFLTVLMTPAILFGCITGYLVHKIQMRLRNIVYFIAIAIGTSIVIWHNPSAQPTAPLILLCLGLFFDAASLAARISTAVTGRHSSRYFLIGFAFYLWAWLSYPDAVLLDGANGLLSLWIRKVPDLICLAVVHILAHAPYGRDSELQNRKHDAEQAGPGYPPQGVGSPDP